MVLCLPLLDELQAFHTSWVAHCLYHFLKMFGSKVQKTELHPCNQPISQQLQMMTGRIQYFDSWMSLFSLCNPIGLMKGPSVKLHCMKIECCVLCENKIMVVFMEQQP